MLKKGISLPLTKRIGLLLIIGILLSVSPLANPAYALEDAAVFSAVNPGSDLQPSTRSLYTQYTYTTLSVVSDVAYANAAFMGYAGVTTRVSITLYLEKKFLWWWNTQETWSQTFAGYSGTLSESAGISGGTYRVKAVYVAYSGSSSETTTAYSSEVKN